jgi:pimeloyl-ACP methyl ester carboxylesterase
VDKDDKSNLSVESLWLNVDGRRAHYLKAGRGQPVILLHGGASDCRDWLPTMESLSDRFTFYAPDLIGFGHSDRDENGYYLGDFSDFVLGFIEELKIDKPSLVGHSFGARVCLDVALKNPGKISRLVLTDASGFAKISWLGNALFAFFSGLRRVLRQRQPFPKFLAKEGEDYNRVADDVLKGIKTPVLLVWKRFDPYLPVAIARRTAKVIPGAKLVVMPGFGHAPNKQDREEFNRLLVTFLDQGQIDKR